ncbi:hypothetical protein [Arcicella aurantiaca]|nr:hypothetical protein [Arcicella aurantiaca]
MSDSSLIKKVEIFKQKNPTFNAPSVTELTDNNSVTGNRYICYFYYKEENQIILTWIKAIDEKQTQFAIVSINDGLELGKWKELNKDYDYFETIKEREKFEKRILQPMQISFKRKSFF